jgi:serine/threonine-protein kinase RsbW
MSPFDPPPASLTVASRLTELTRVRLFVEAICRRGGLDTQTTASIVLAVHEAAANIIRHAHRGQADLPLHIHCAWLPDGFEVRLEDVGQPFDINAIPEIDPTEVREGGRGVYLMRVLMDELDTLPRADGGNTLRMVKRCQPRDPQSKPAS